jgi:hypothetical protein
MDFLSFQCLRLFLILAGLALSASVPHQLVFPSAQRACRLSEELLVRQRYNSIERHRHHQIFAINLDQVTMYFDYFCFAECGYRSRPRLERRSWNAYSVCPRLSDTSLPRSLARSSGPPIHHMKP